MMDSFKIERIPIPIRRNKYPWDKLQVGDSFYTSQKLSSVSAAAIYFGNKQTPRRKFLLRSEKDGCRVWRIE